MKNLIISSLLIIIGLNFSVGQVIKPSSMQAYSDGSNITLRWNTEDETQVEKFIVERRAGRSGNFIQIANINPKGPSLYEFIDNTAFRSNANIYQYQVRIKFNGNLPDQEIGPLTVMHAVNSVKRTWGSIKAMFR